MGNNIRTWMRIVESWGSFNKQFRGWLAQFNDAAGPVHVDIVGRGANATIENITSENKQRGHASTVMAKLCDLADAHGVTLSLQPVSYADHGEAEGGLGMDDLIMWYERYGFELDGETGWMSRPPT